MALDHDNQMTSDIQGGVDATPSHEVSCQFYREEFLSEHAIFSSCTHIPKTHFDIGLVRIGSYSYEI